MKHSYCCRRWISSGHRPRKDHLHPLQQALQEAPRELPVPQPHRPDVPLLNQNKGNSRQKSKKSQGIYCGTRTTIIFSASQKIATTKSSRKLIGRSVWKYIPIRIVHLKLMRLLRKSMQPWRVSQTQPSAASITNLGMLIVLRELSLVGRPAEAEVDITSIAVTSTSLLTMTLSTLKSSSTSCFSATSPKEETEDQRNNSKDNSSIDANRVSKWMVRTLDKQWDNSFRCSFSSSWLFSRVCSQVALSKMGHTTTILCSEPITMSSN